MTQNIWNYNRPWRQRRELIVDLIQREGPDIVCLQETRHDFRYEGGRGQGEQLAALTGYQLVTAVGQVYFPAPRVDEGLTILTRSVPVRTMSAPLTRFPHLRKDGNRRVCLGVTVATDRGEVDVYDAHFSMSSTARSTNAREVADFITRESGGRAALLLGDLNGAPDTEPIQFLTGPEGGFLDCWTAANPEDPGFTYSAWQPYHRIDYVLARNTGPIRSARIVGQESRNGVYGSDHLGVVVDLDVVS